MFYSLYSSIALRAVLLSLILITISWLDSPTTDESSHLMSGVAEWDGTHPNLYYVNPPLVRMLVALPTYIWYADQIDLQEVQNPSLAFWGGMVGSNFLHQDLRRADRCVSMGRLMLIPVMLLGLFFIERLTDSLFSGDSEHLAGWLYAFSPAMLAVGHNLAADGAFVTAILACCYTVLLWSREPRLLMSCIVGIVFGFALLIKTTAILLVPLWLGWMFIRRPACVGLVVVAGVVAWTQLNAFFWFDGTFSPLESYNFNSQALGGVENATVTNESPKRDPVSGHIVKPFKNRFAGMLIGKMPILIPKFYILGIDFQKSDFEVRRPTLIFGEYRLGRWYDHLLSFVIKTPLGILFLLVVAIIGATLKPIKSYRLASILDVSCVALPFVFLLILNLSQTGMTFFYRYVSGCEALLIVLIAGAVTKFYPNAGPSLAKLGAIATAGSVLFWLPHTHDYYHELVGGPNGGAQIAFASADIGQNLYRIESTLKRLPKDVPVRVTQFHFYLANLQSLGYKNIRSAENDSNFSSLFAEEFGLIDSPNSSPGDAIVNTSGWIIFAVYDLATLEAQTLKARAAPEDISIIKTIAPGLWLGYRQAQKRVLNSSSADLQEMD